MIPTTASSPSRGVGEVLAALVSSDGSAAHPYSRSPLLRTAPFAMRNLADASHFLCILHGRYPGVIDMAGERIIHAAAREWIYRAADGFATERAYLTRLVVAAGPLPSTLGQAQSEAAVATQTHALATLARSDRNGTALGASLALVLDWRAIRPILDAAADRFGVQQPPVDLPGTAETVATAVAAAEMPGIERAVAFGAQQLLAQHRGLWDLLETREMARREA